MVFSATAIHRWMGLLLQKRVNTGFHTSQRKKHHASKYHSRVYTLMDLCNFAMFVIEFCCILLQLCRGLGGSSADRFIFIHIPIRTTCRPLLSKKKSYVLNQTYCAFFVCVCLWFNVRIDNVSLIWRHHNYR